MLQSLLTMVKVVISFAESDKSGDYVITGGVAVVKRLISKPVG